MSLLKLNVKLLDLSAASATLSTLAIIYITSRQHLALEKWLPSLHWLAVAVFALGEKARRRLISGASVTQRPDFMSRVGWDIMTGALLATQHTFYLWSFLKLPSATAIMMSLLVVPLNLGLLSFFPPSAAFKISATATRVSGAVLLLIIALGIVSAGRQEHLCTLLALGAVVCGAIISRLSLTKRAANPYSFTSIMVAIPLSIFYACTIGGRVHGYKYYYPEPMELSVVSSILFAAWFTISQGGRAAFSVGGANVPTVQTLSARGALTTQCLPPLISSSATMLLMIFSGSYVDLTGGRGPVWLQLSLVSAGIGFVLWMAPQTDDESSGEEDGGYNLLPAEAPRAKTPSSLPIPSSVVPVVSTISLIPILAFFALQSGMVPYRPSWDALSTLTLVPPALPGTLTLRPIGPPPSFEASPLLETFGQTGLAPHPQLEIVFAYYEEPVAGLRVIIDDVKKEINWWNTKVTVYHKGLKDLHTPRNATAKAQQKEILAEFMAQSGVDEVVPLENIGREGATYLRHIIHHYDNLAYQTIFLQGHVVFEDEFWERLKLINERTGFMSFGHYLTVTHGTDNWGNGDFPRVGDIYEKFRQAPYPHEPLLATYHGQFVVSRERIHRHPKRKYEELLAILEAPMNDPIHNEGYGYKDVPEGPENPFFGHSLERSWTLIFECDDPKIEKDCWLADPVSYRCYCADF